MKKTSHRLDFRKNVGTHGFIQNPYYNLRSEFKIGFNQKQIGEDIVNKTLGVAGVVPIAGAHMNNSMNYLL